MAPLKIEEQMKDKLEARTISPSQDAWNSLEAKLDKEKPKSSKSALWWMGPAAAAAVLIILLINWGQKDEAPMEVIPLVESEEGGQIPGNMEATDQKTGNDEENAKTEIASGLMDEKEADGPLHKAPRSAKEQIKKISVPETDAVVAREKSVQKIPDFESPQAGIDLKEETIAELMPNEEFSGPDELDSEVDQLLSKAMKNIIKVKTVRTDNQSIQADVLLGEVENDLDRSFRDRIFKALVSGYESVKTAVAERNN